MPALQRAIALAKVDRLAAAVAQHLDLDVPRPFEILLDVDAVIAEGGAGFCLSGGQAGCELGFAVRTTFMPRPPPPAVAFMITG